MKIFLVRHGESVDDIEDCWGGMADFPLTEAGRQTASALAQKLVGSGIEVIYSSPYKRAHETATIVAQSLGRSIKVVDGLKERNSYGVITGVNKAKAKEIFGHILSKLKGKLGDYYGTESVPGDESVTEFDLRVRKAIDEIIADSKQNKTIAIVTHGNVTRSIYKNLLKVAGKIDLELLALTEITATAGELKIDRNEGVVVKA